MIDFAITTSFRLVRRLTMGQGAAAMYLLIHAEETRRAIEADLEAEIEVQLGKTLQVSRVSELADGDEALGLRDAAPIRVLWIDQWRKELVPLLDTHVIRLERTGAQFLFFSTPALAKQLLIEAPNFRNRLTEVLQIVPEDPSGSGQR